MKKPLNLPHFKSEDEEHEYWARFDLDEYFDETDFEPVSFPNLKPTTRPISTRLPVYLIQRIKEQANRLDIPYQSLMKLKLSELLDADQHTKLHKTKWPMNTTYIQTRYVSRTDPLTNFLINWQRFWHLYRLWWQAEDLEHLMRWAARKGFKQRNYYEHLWLETHQRLNRYHLRLPTLSKWAYRLYLLISLLTPTPRYYPKGSAAGYRRSQYRMQMV